MKRVDQGEVFNSIREYTIVYNAVRFRLIKVE